MHRFNPPENLFKSGRLVLGTTVGGVSFCNQMNVPVVLEQGPVFPKVFAYESLDAISRDSLAYPFSDGDTQSAVLLVTWCKKHDKKLILQFFTIFNKVNKL